MTDSAAGGASRAGGWALGWGLLALLLAYVACVHHAIGPAPEGFAPRWFEPRGTLKDLDFTAPLVSSFPRALLFVGGPAVLLATGVCIAVRSAVARAVAVSCAMAVALMVFYGVSAEFAWRFFHWRGSLTILGTAAGVGFAAAAPWLAASWLRRGWPVRIAIYAPVVLGVIALMRNVTGTDESLRFAISPWPAIPVFGFEVGALFLCTGTLGVGVGLFGIEVARRRSAGRPLAALAALPGLATPCALLALGAWLGTLPFTLGPVTLTAVIATCTVALLAAATVPVRSSVDGISRRARLSVIGAALVGVPLIAGQALTRFDYHVTREVRAGAIVDALEAHLERESLYPDELSELVDAGWLEALPEMQIGFALLSDADFRYRNFGSSYVLEFSAPRWVECAYTPPYPADEDDGAADPDEEPLGGAWSCPSRPPELW